MIDASNKQIYALNGYKTAHKNLVTFVTNGDKATFVGDIFRPAKLGDFTKDNLGSVKNIGFHPNKKIELKVEGAPLKSVKKLKIKKRKTMLN